MLDSIREGKRRCREDEGNTARVSADKLRTLDGKQISSCHGETEVEPLRRTRRKIGRKRGNEEPTRA